jgi:hypothetical protein
MEDQNTHICTSYETRNDRELTEVRWVSLAEADELMSGAIYEPVRQHVWGVLNV